jgi:signal transduction histidine kinase
VAARAERLDGGRRLAVIVDDDGPGLTEAERKRAVKRGQRLDESKPGSGLGLSIVADLAHLYKGRFELEPSPLGGLRARLELPAA